MPERESWKLPPVSFDTPFGRNVKVLRIAEPNEHMTEFDGMGAKDSALKKCRDKH